MNVSEPKGLPNVFVFPEFIEMAGMHERCDVAQAEFVPKAKLDRAIEALDKIRDPRKRHSEPDKYTELACVMNIADECLKELGAGE